MPYIDGTVRIRCSDCGEVICKQLYMGFSTALCVKCQQRREELEKELKALKIDPGKASALAGDIRAAEGSRYDPGEAAALEEGIRDLQEGRVRPLEDVKRDLQEGKSGRGKSKSQKAR